MEIYSCFNLIALAVVLEIEILKKVATSNPIRPQPSRFGSIIRKGHFTFSVLSALLDSLFCAPFLCFKRQFLGGVWETCFPQRNLAPSQFLPLNAHNILCRETWLPKPFFGSLKRG
jgi:hypothetical protein